MDFDTFDTDVWAEINDMPGEIYDIEEEKFNVEEYINGNTDYWSWIDLKCYHNANNLWRTLTQSVMISFIVTTTEIYQKQKN